MRKDDPYLCCTLCPRDCGINRRSGITGLCGETTDLRLANAGLHFGEEPPLTGERGSGTVFLTGCSMHCPFCQNHQISRSGVGRVVGADEFLDICFALRDAGAANLNLVTPSHMVPTLADYLLPAEGAGFDLPVAWNSSGYEALDCVRQAAVFTDIWLPDLKTLDSEVAHRIYGLADYPENAAAAILAMAEYGEPEVSDDGLMKRGLMVRHLALPGELESSRKVLKWFSEHLKGRAWLSLMTQYTPVLIPGEKRKIPGRQLSGMEYDILLGWLDDFGIDDGYVQELVPGDDWLPDFCRPNPFSSRLSRIVWRWDTGFVRD